MTSPHELALVVAMDENRVIGIENRLPWHLPADLKNFKDLTTGCPVIMGRKTHESIHRLLPGRINIVITRDPRWKARVGAAPELEVATSLDEAIEMCGAAPKIFVIGGAEIFKLALPRADLMYVTYVQTKLERGDTYFPEIDPADWQAVSETRVDADDKNAFAMRFVVYRRTR